MDNQKRDGCRVSMITRQSGLGGPQVQRGQCDLHSTPNLFFYPTPKQALACKLLTDKKSMSGGCGLGILTATSYHNLLLVTYHYAPRSSVTISRVSSSSCTIVLVQVGLRRAGQKPKTSVSCTRANKPCFACALHPGCVPPFATWFRFGRLLLLHQQQQQPLDAFNRLRFDCYTRVLPEHWT